MGGRIDNQVIILQHLVLFPLPFLELIVAPHVGFDPGYQFDGAEGLGNKIISAQPQAEHFVDIFVFATYKENGNRTNFAQFAANFKAIKTGQEDIENDQVRSVLLCHEEGFMTIIGRKDLISFPLTRMMVKKAAVAALTAGSILITGLHHFVLFLRLPNRYPSLWFGLICLILGIRNLVDGPFLFAFFFPDLSNNVLVTLEYIGFVGSCSLATLFIYSFFPGMKSPRIRNGLTIPGLVFLLIVLFTPVYVFTQLAVVMQAYTIVVGFVLLHYIFRAVIRKLEGAVLLAAGSIFFFVTIVNDILVNNTMLTRPLKICPAV